MSVDIDSKLNNPIKVKGQLVNVLVDVCIYVFQKVRCQASVELPEH